VLIYLATGICDITGAAEVIGVIEVPERFCNVSGTIDLACGILPLFPAVRICPSSPREFEIFHDTMKNLFLDELDYPD
jgi:hypothetical protein